jgi:hypothetical protein
MIRSGAWPGSRRAGFSRLTLATPSKMDDRCGWMAAGSLALDLIAANKARARMEAELAEAREDSARLDWLESKGLSTTHDANARDYGVHNWQDRENNRRMWTARRINSELRSLRAAIDAARYKS